MIPPADRLALRRGYSHLDRSAGEHSDGSRDGNVGNHQDAAGVLDSWLPSQNLGRAWHRSSGGSAAISDGNHDGNDGSHQRPDGSPKQPSTVARSDLNWASATPEKQTVKGHACRWKTKLTDCTVDNSLRMWTAEGPRPG